MAVAAVDLFARILLVERKDALPWGVDPAADPDEGQALRPANNPRVLLVLENGSPSVGSLVSSPGTFVKGTVRPEITVLRPPVEPVDNTIITPLGVLLKLMTSPRAVVCIFSTFVYG